MKEIDIKVLFDSNVIIDAITDRDNSSNAAKSLFTLEAAGEIKGYLVSKQITDIYYVLRKYLPLEDRNSFVKYLLASYEILSLSSADLETALNNGNLDYEDNVLIAVAINNSIDYIVTNNKKDFINSAIKVVTPEELVSFYEM